MLQTAPAIVAAAALLGASTAIASPPAVVHFAGTETHDPQIGDLPCLEGTQFLITSGESFHGTIVSDSSSVHITNIEKFFATAVPVDGQGPTYVEAPNVNKTNFTLRKGATGDQIVETNINNDRFIGYVDGNPVSSATIRVHQVEHVVGVDTDGDGQPDTVKVSVSLNDFSCPDG